MNSMSTSRLGTKIDPSSRSPPSPPPVPVMFASSPRVPQPAASAATSAAWTIRAPPAGFIPPYSLSQQARSGREKCVRHEPMASFRGTESGWIAGALACLMLAASGDRAEAADGGVRNVDGGAKATPAPAAKPAGPSPFTDYTVERPGKRVKITAADLPAARVNRDVDNPPHVVKRPKG